MAISEYTKSEGGPLSWASVNKNIAAVSDAQFKHHAEAFYGRKPKQGLFSKLAQMFKGSNEPSSDYKASLPRRLPGLEKPSFMSGLGFVTDSPLFDNPGGFYRPLTNEEDIRLRASAQAAMEAGRPMTVAEMYGKPQQLFTTLHGADSEEKKQVAIFYTVVAAIIASQAVAWYLKEANKETDGDQWKWYHYVLLPSTIIGTFFVRERDNYEVIFD